MTSTWILTWSHYNYIYYTAWYAIFLKKSFMIWNFAKKCSKMFQIALKALVLKSTHPNWLGSSLVLSSLNQNRHFSWGVTTFIFFFTPKYLGFISKEVQFWNSFYLEISLGTTIEISRGFVQIFEQIFVIEIFYMFF